MPTNLKYMPTFRARQQEMIALKAFNFGSDMYPLLEIIKEHDRVQNQNSTKTFIEVYGELINSIQAGRVFVDLPFYLKPSGSMNKEVLKFLYKVSYNMETRTEYLLQFANNPKVIPVISSYLQREGVTNSISTQLHNIHEAFESICFRVGYQTFDQDLDEIDGIVRPEDFIILDLDTVSPYPSHPALKPLVRRFKEFTTCPKIILRSAIGNEIQNVTLDHGTVIFEADNSLLENFKQFGADAFGDYCGIKKDDITAGGAISPGFIYFDADDNKYWGFKGTIKNLEEFEKTIVPDVLACDATQRMLAAHEAYLDDSNNGYATIVRISQGLEPGKSQAKFKKIAMEHYLACMRKIIQHAKYGYE